MNSENYNSVPSLQDLYQEIMNGTENENYEIGESLAQPYQVKFVQSITTNHTIDPQQSK